MSPYGISTGHDELMMTVYDFCFSAVYLLQILFYYCFITFYEYRIQNFMSYPFELKLYLPLLISIYTDYSNEDD